MAAAHAASFIPTCHTISVQGLVRQMTASHFTPRLSLQWNILSRNAKPAIRTRPWKSRIIAMAQGNHVKKVTAKELDTILDGLRDCPIVVDFYATWCGPCILLSQELEQLAVEYGKAVKFLKVDTDEEFELASEMKIQGLPTLIFVSKDVEKNAIRTEGLLSADVIRNIIENDFGYNQVKTALEDIEKTGLKSISLLKCGTVRGCLVTRYFLSKKLRTVQSLAKAKSYN